MRSLGGIVAALLLACTGSKPPIPDGGEKCLGNMMSPVYDPCSTEHDCLSGMCQAFQMSGFQVCTVSCATSACPNDVTGHAGTCNAMMICKPAQPNACHL
jgi:hypothetical protein